MLKRYEKNIDIILTENIQKQLLNKHIAVIGCGGQGGYILEFLARLGVSSISFWDGDVYEESNLNRQIGCLINNLGQKKVDVLTQRLLLINNSINYYPHNWFFGDKESDLNDINHIDFIFYTADYNYNLLKMRNILREVIVKGVPLIDAPVTQLGGWIHIETNEDLGHFDYITEKYSKDLINKNFKANQSAYKCAIIAGEAVNQMIQYFSNSRYACKNTTLNIDLYHHKYSQSDRFGVF